MYKFQTNNSLEILWLKFANHKEGRWVMGIENAVKLYELVKRYEPTQILELGTGIGAGTAIMASALDNGRILTIDQSERCIELAKELIPFELREKITFEYAPVCVMKPIEEVDPFVYWSQYMPYTWNNPELVVIDGPAPFMFKEHFVNLPNGDILKLLPIIKPKTKVFVDGRKDAVKLYKRFLNHYLQTLESTDTYTLFERTDLRVNEDLNDLINSDLLRGDAELNNYL